jgi:hypothetical protein
MKFNIQESIQILARTPIVIDQMLRYLPDEWITSNEGGETWSPYDIVGHLIHGEQTDWIARLEIILSDSPNKKFTPFDRFAQFHESNGKSINQLLDEFKQLRLINLNLLKSKRITIEDFNRKGIHPDFGEVNLKNLLATWVVHDLDHVAQIARVLSYHYKEEVGPWKKYLRILNISTKE